MKDVIEQIENCFEGSSYSGGVIKDVAIFGKRKSTNNRVYEDTAINDLKNLSENLKCFVDHPSKTEMEQNKGVRSVRDWLGTFNSPKRNGETITANLRVREQYQPLISDIIKLQPSGVGMSINARVKVYQGEDGMESVKNVELLRSADLVSSAATTTNLFEAALDDENEWFNNDEEEEEESDFDCVCSKEAIMEAKSTFINEVQGTEEPEEDAVEEFIDDLRR